MRRISVPKNNKSSRISVAYWDPAENRIIKDTYHSYFYTSMLIKDIHLGIMPWQEYTANKVEALLEPESKDINELVVEALTSPSDYISGLYESVRKFIDEAAHIIASVGEVFYEIVYFTEEGEILLKGFQLHLLPIGIVEERRKVFRQHIPKGVQKDRELEKDYVDIPKDLIIHIQMPKAIGGLIEYKKLLEDLKIMSATHYPPDFAVKEIAEPGFESIFSLDYFNRTNDLILAKETKKIGWFMRSWVVPNKRTTEFYSIYRFLKFNKFKALLRETIIDSLNDALIRIGKKMQFSAKITLTGITSSEEIETIISSFLNGEIEFSEVYKRIL